MTDDRDVYVPKHETPRGGVPTFVEEEATGKYEGEELAARRAKRETHDRIARVEKKQDEQTKATHSLEKTVERLCGKLEAYVDAAKEANKTDRLRISTRAKVVGAVVTAIGVIVAAYLGAGCVS